jgi:hypothetical protein
MSGDIPLRRLALLAAHALGVTSSLAAAGLRGAARRPRGTPGIFVFCEGSSVDRLGLGEISPGEVVSSKHYRVHSQIPLVVVGSIVAGDCRSPGCKAVCIAGQAVEGGQGCGCPRCERHNAPTSLGFHGRLSGLATHLEYCSLVARKQAAEDARQDGFEMSRVLLEGI